MGTETSRRSVLAIVGGLGAVALGAGVVGARGPASAASVVDLDVNASALDGHWTALRGTDGTGGEEAVRSKPHVNVIVGGIAGDAFDAAVVSFGNLDSMDSRELKDMIVRKRPGRTKFGHVVELPAVQIPEPERDAARVEVRVDLYAGGAGDDEIYVASGSDVVAVANAECVTNCVAK